MDKNKILKNNISWGLIWKGVSFIVSYLTIPFLLKYLGDEYYGIWITIYVILNIAYFMDLGIYLGLRNKLTESFSKQDSKQTKQYLSTAYFSFGIVVLLMLIFGLILIYSLNLQNVFNTSLDSVILRRILILSLFLVSISIILNLFKTIFEALQKSAKVEMALAFYQILVLIQILLLPLFIKQSIFWISFIYGFSNIVIALIFSINFFSKNPDLFPSFNFFSKEKLKDIMSLGFHFFIIQLSLIVIFSTDNLIITHYVNPVETTIYSNVLKVFQPILILSAIIFKTLWPLYNNAFQNTDIHWIRNTLRKLNYYFFIIILILLVVYFSFDGITKIWLGRIFVYNDYLLIFMSLFVLLRIYGDIYMTFVNGIGKIKLQMWLYIFGAIINIPLSIWFIKHTDLGSSGVILATSISILPLTILIPIQTIKILKSKASKALQ